MKPIRQRFVRDNRTIERVLLPSLFDQLADAVQSGAGGRTRGVQSSKAPLDLLALSLLIDIATAVRNGCWNWKLRRTRDTPKDLRQIVSAVCDYGDDDTTDQAASMVRSWVRQISTLIACDPERRWRMHGGQCRVCSSTTVPVWLDDGTESRQPALIVHSEDGVISAVTCDFCGSTLTGDDLTAIVLSTLNATGGRAKTGISARVTGVHPAMPKCPG